MIIVTGSAGMIGSAIIAKLNYEGINDIIAVDRLDTSCKWKNLRNLDFADYLDQGDLLAFVKTASKKEAKKITAIIHMGACSATTQQDGAFLMENNYKYSQTLAKFCMANNIRFIGASSGATYGAGELGYDDDDEVSKKLVPLNPYGYSKQLFDLWLIKNKFQKKVVSLKFFNVYGPNEYHKADMCSGALRSYEQLMKEGYVSLFKSNTPEYGDGEQKRDFVYVKDCASVVYWFLKNKKANGIFNVGTGKAQSWNDLARAVCSATGRADSIKYIDMPPILKNQYQSFTEAKITKLKKAGYKEKFCSIEEGVTDYVQKYLIPGKVNLTGENW